MSSLGGGMWSKVGRVAYSVYSALIAVCFIVPAVFALTLIPKLQWRWRLGNRVVRLILSTIRLPLAVEGSDEVGDRAQVVVANHASFIDGLVLTAVFPNPVTFVIAAEIGRQPVVGYVLRRIGAEFIERHDPLRAAVESRRLIERLQQGATVVFFPEGTLNPALGVRPFLLGAFVAASRAEVRVLPVGIRGTRGVLSPGQRLLHPGRLHVSIGEPILPGGRGRSEVLALAETSYRAVVALSGEPELHLDPKSSTGG